MTPPFEDIVIVDLDVQKTTWSRVHSAMRTLYLRLNRDPDVAWNKYFFEERNARVELKRHGLWIEDGYIVFDCLLIDVDNHHLPDIRRSITYANERSRELRESQRAEREQLKARARDEAEVLKSLRANIREERTAAAPALFEMDAPEPTTAQSLEDAAHAQLQAQPEPTTAQSLEDAAHAQLQAPSEPAAPVQAALPDHERRLRDFYDAFAPKFAAAEMPAQPASIAPEQQDDISQQPTPPLAAEEPHFARAVDNPAAPLQTPAAMAESAPAADEKAEPASPPEASEQEFEFKRNDWRARFRAALQRNDK